jgi:hypothetical protein
MPRCFSKCKKRPNPPCSSDYQCKWIDGAVRKYCRLSPKYKMNKDCKLRRKFTKKEAKLAIKDLVVGKHRIRKNRATRRARIRSSTNSSSPTASVYETASEASSTKASSTKALSTKNSNSAKRKLAKFIHTKKFKIKANYLKKVCLDSSECIAFGTELQNISNFFDNFTTFTYLKNIRQIGDTSSNGTVYQLSYKREGYESHALMKFSNKNEADNLMYEYDVGLFINKMAKKYPCFVETYGLYRIDDATHTSIINKTLNAKTLQKFRPQTRVNYAVGCVDSRLNCILTQHIKDAFSLYDICHHSIFLNRDLLYSLAQIYLPLCALGNTFTHYDLHLSNVLLYRPRSRTYIQYHYNITGLGTVTFKCGYMVKIIDYGRSYFKDSENHNSKQIYDTIGGKIECQNSDKKGFSWLENEPLNAKNYFMDSAKPNVSHDLRALKLIKYNTNIVRHLPSNLKNMLTKLQYKSNYGTAPKTKCTSDKICNVTEAAKYLCELIKNQNTINQNNLHYQSRTKLGDLYISDKSNIRWVPA